MRFDRNEELAFGMRSQPVDMYDKCSGDRKWPWKTAIRRRGGGAASTKGRMQPETAANGHRMAHLHLKMAEAIGNEAHEISIENMGFLEVT